MRPEDGDPLTVIEDQERPAPRRRWVLLAFACCLLAAIAIGLRVAG